jgi:hypothetical protein
MTGPPKHRRCEGRVRVAVVGVAVCSCLAAACHRGAEATLTLTAQPASTPAAVAGTVPHGDHNPHHDGIVLMNGDLHFEVVLGRDGRHRVYFSDATRAELPAATASNVTVTIMQKGQQPDAVALHIDDSGESWTGGGRRVEDPAATARIAYSSHGKPYFIDVPFPH